MPHHKGNHMIRVIIERHIAPTLEEHFDQIERSILQSAVVVPGYISGESFKNVQDPNHRFILCTWRSVQDWHQWHQSDERKAMLANLTPLMDREEQITVLELS